MSLQFGPYIALLRQARGFTLRTLAQTLGISMQYLSDLEGSRRNPPPLPLLRKLAEVLDGSLEYLVVLSGQFPGLDLLLSDMDFATLMPEDVEAGFAAFRDTMRRLFRSRLRS